MNTGIAPSLRATCPYTPKNSSTSGKLEGLQILRFVAAALVLLAHLKFTVRPFSNAFTESAFGAVGVDIFFVISGFVIALTSSKLDHNYRLFFAHRIARIVPLYYLLSSGFILRSFFHSWKTDCFSRLWNSLFFIPLFDFEKFTGTGHLYGWSISFEMWFYVLFGTILAFLGARRARLVMPIALCAAVIFIFPIYHGRWNMPRFAFHPMVLEFSAGCILFHFRHRLHWSVVSVFVLLLPILAYEVVVHEQLGRHEMVLSDPILGYSRALIWGSFAVCLVGSVVYWDQRATVHFPRWIILLGDASYSIYLIQPFTGLLAAKMFPSGGIWGGGLFAFGSIAGGLLLYMFVERNLTIRARPMLEKLFRAKNPENLLIKSAVLETIVPSQGLSGERP